MLTLLNLRGNVSMKNSVENSHELFSFDKQNFWNIKEFAVARFHSANRLIYFSF